MSNQAVALQKARFSVVINSDGYKRLINSTLGDPNRARRFVASITSAVAVNSALQVCTPASILSGALLGESLNLSPSPQLGMYYLVPFKRKAKYSGNTLVEPEHTDAVFVLGYKGYLQLALRSGQYKDIDALVIREGEYLGRDPETGKPKFKFFEDDSESRPVIGYMAYFTYLNGFTKSIFWSREKMIDHADKYSAAFSKEAVKTKKFEKVSFADYAAKKYPPEDEWKYSSFWYSQFDDMAKKTLLRQLISKWGIMSIETQTALESDGNVVGGSTLAYVTDSELPPGILPEHDELPEDIQDELPEGEPNGEVSLDDL